VFFNLFFEAEPFAAILIADGTHGHYGRSQKLVCGTVKFEAEGKERASGSGEHYMSSLSGVRGTTDFGYIRAHKMRSL